MNTNKSLKKLLKQVQKTVNLERANFGTMRDLIKLKRLYTKFKNNG